MNCKICKYYKPETKTYGICNHPKRDHWNRHTKPEYYGCTLADGSTLLKWTKKRKKRKLGELLRKLRGSK